MSETNFFFVIFWAFEVMQSSGGSGASLEGAQFLVRMHSSAARPGGLGVTPHECGHLK